MDASLGNCAHGGTGERRGAPVLNTQKEKVSYAAGVDMARSLQRQGVEVDRDLFLKGVKDGLSGGTLLLSDDDINKMLKAFKTEQKMKLAERKYQQSEQLRKQRQAAGLAGEENRKAGEAFLAANKAKDGVVTLPSGLQYRILKAGDGGKPSDADTVECRYRGTLIDGTEFDRSDPAGQPATFKVAGVIPGWREALKLMPTGSKWQLFIPPQLAYGARGRGPRHRAERDPDLRSGAPRRQVTRGEGGIVEYQLMNLREKIARWLSPLLDVALRSRTTVKFFLTLGIFISANYLAWLVRFEFDVPPEMAGVMWQTIPVLVIAKALGFLVSGQFRGWWRYVSIKDVLPIAAGSALGSVLFAAGVWGLWGPFHVPRSIYLLDWVNTMALVLGARYLIRMGREGLGRRRRGTDRRVLIVGAGAAGQMIAREIAENVSLGMEQVGFIDDDRRRSARGSTG